METEWLDSDEREAWLRIEDGRGMLVRVTTGGVWITEEGDQRDRFVSTGGALRA